MENGAPTNLVIRRSVFELSEGFSPESMFRRDHEDIMNRHGRTGILSRFARTRVASLEKPLAFQVWTMYSTACPRMEEAKVGALATPRS